MPENVKALLPWRRRDKDAMGASVSGLFDAHEGRLEKAARKKGLFDPNSDGPFRKWLRDGGWKILLDLLFGFLK